MGSCVGLRLHPTHMYPFPPYYTWAQERLNTPTQTERKACATQHQGILVASLKAWVGSEAFRLWWRTLLPRGLTHLSCDHFSLWDCPLVPSRDLP